MAESRNYIDENNVEITTEIEDAENVISALGLSVKELINLAGGIPSDKIKELHLKAVSSSENVIEIYVTTNLYEVVRILNFEMLYINNTHMYVFDQQNEIGTKLFCNQVIASKERGFKVIYTTAMGKEDGDNWTGYYAWGRLGYKMILGDEDRFINTMVAANRKERDIWELLSYSDGRAFWLENGFTWMGEFLLDNDSPAINQLRNYLKEKGKAFGID